jgi:hypothetical protein
MTFTWNRSGIRMVPARRPAPPPCGSQRIPKHARCRDQSHAVQCAVFRLGEHRGLLSPRRTERRITSDLPLGPSGRPLRAGRPSVPLPPTTQVIPHYLPRVGPPGPGRCSLRLRSHNSPFAALRDIGWRQCSCSLRRPPPSAPAGRTDPRQPLMRLLALRPSLDGGGGGPCSGTLAAFGVQRR